jgi:hypothetical protein
MTDTVAGVLLTYGPLGIFAGMMALGYIVPRPFYTRLERENDALRKALEAERARGDASTAAAATTNQVIGALKQVVDEIRDQPPGRSPGWRDLR